MTLIKVIVHGCLLARPCLASVSRLGCEMSTSDVIQSASFCMRTVDGRERETPWAGVHASAVVMTRPWRTFRWHKGQRHYPGFYWSSTERAHVIYESRLELTRLLFADFDPTVQRGTAGATTALVPSGTADFRASSTDSGESRSRIG